MIVVIVYHKNLLDIYPFEWISLFKESILKQTRKDFVIYELNYGGGEERIFIESEFESFTLPSFVHAMNVLIDKAFKDGATAVFNTNVDDWYGMERIQKQMEAINKGFDVVASNFCLVEGNSIYHEHKFHFLDINSELGRNHNVIGHPVVAISKRFWDNNRYEPEEIPYEDLKIWQRALHNSSFIILPDMLLYHRVHKNSVCNSNNR